MSDVPESKGDASAEIPGNPDKPSRKRWKKWLIEAVIVIVVIAGIRLWQQRNMVQGPAPALQGVALSGSGYQLPAHPEKPVLVHFWATWCPVCRAEQGSIDAISSDHPVITIASWSKDEDEVRKFVAEQHLKFPVIYDADGRIAKRWGVYAVPASYIVGQDGNISFRETGYTSEWGLRLRLWLAGKL